MIECKDLYDSLVTKGVDFFTGVPDSLLKHVCAYINDHASAENHLISPNEGNSIALAAGYHMATGKLPLVYMQNSGLGNAVNPLTSLADNEVYSIPILLMIGWRGQPGVKDEPQHVKQGRISEALLKILEIPYIVLNSDWDKAQKQVEEIIQQAKQQSKPCAILVKSNTFNSYKPQKNTQTHAYELSREEVIKIILENLPLESKIVSTTGKTSRELYEVRELRKDPHFHDFLTVGCMGHASQIAFGLALKGGLESVYCFDGDGAALMHMGSLAQIGVSKLKNFKHILFNNAAHESVGGQPTVADRIDLQSIASATGYNWVRCVESENQLLAALPDFIKSEGPSLLEVKIKIGSRADLGRPKESPAESKVKFMTNLHSEKLKLSA